MYLNEYLLNDGRLHSPDFNNEATFLYKKNYFSFMKISKTFDKTNITYLDDKYDNQLEFKNNLILLHFLRLFNLILIDNNKLAKDKVKIGVIIA